MPVQQSAAPPYGRLLVEIERDELQEARDNPQITGCAYVASYTWLARAVPSIVVPGERHKTPLSVKCLLLIQYLDKRACSVDASPDERSG